MKELALLKLISDLMSTIGIAIGVVQRVNAVLTKAKESGGEVTNEMQAELDLESLKIKTALTEARRKAGFID